MTSTSSVLDPEQIVGSPLWAKNQQMVPDVTIVSNDAGGKSSYIEERYDLIPADALRAVAALLGRAVQRYGKDNWRLLGVEDNLNHAVRHIYLHLEGRTDENHLINAACRTLFALSLELERQQNGTTTRDATSLCST